MYTQKTNKGSVLIITIIITAILLSIGTTLASILEKEFTRQAYSKQSRLAMNMANSALECVLFNDFHRSMFQSLIERKYNEVGCGKLYQVRKNNESNTWVVYTPSSDEGVDDEPGTGIYQFVVIDSEKEDLSDAQVPCAHITVSKRCVGGPTDDNICENGLIETSIEVKGYSSCSSGESESDRKLVRRFKVYY